MYEVTQYSHYIGKAISKSRRQEWMSIILGLCAIMILKNHNFKSRIHPKRQLLARNRQLQGETTY